MRSDLSHILKLEVPVIVVLGRRDLAASDVLSLAPGAMIELTKLADEELELLVNNKVIGVGRAVKVGESFGIRISYIGDLKNRIAALGEEDAASKSEQDLDALAESMLAGQG